MRGAAGLVRRARAPRCASPDGPPRCRPGPFEPGDRVALTRALPARGRLLPALPAGEVGEVLDVAPVGVAVAFRGVGVAYAPADLRLLPGPATRPAFAGTIARCRPAPPPGPAAPRAR